MRWAIVSALLCFASPAVAIPACSQPDGPVQQGDASLYFSVEGEGNPVMLIPSLGRGPADFDQLARDLVSAGYAAIRYQPRWFGRSDGPALATLDDLAADAAAVASSACPGQPVTVIGHALGNRIARAMSAANPGQVGSVILLAAGGQTPISEDLGKAIAISASEGIVPDRERLAALRTAFFANEHQADLWLTGWNPRAAELQARAVQAQRDTGWIGAGGVPLLVVQPTEDPVAPMENAEKLIITLGDQVTVVTLSHASHAILPEQPAAVSGVVLAWLGGERQGSRLQRRIDHAVVRP